MPREKRKNNSKNNNNNHDDGSSIKEILEEVAAKGKSLLDGGLEGAREMFEDKKDYLKEKAGELKDKKVGEVAHDIKEFVEKNPWKSAAIAAGLGFVLGSIFKSDD